MRDTPTRAQLLSLAERVEKGPPSPELDEAVAEALGFTWGFGHPRLSASTDAALSLVDLKTVELRIYGDTDDFEVSLDKDGGSGSSVAPTIPQAITAAALRLKASEVE